MKAIYDRDCEIENFKPETYYALVSRAKTNGEVIELVSGYKFSDKEKAEKCCGSNKKCRRGRRKSREAAKDLILFVRSCSFVR